MRFFRCECGTTRAWSSLGSPACCVCPECKTTLAEGPGRHVTPEPHMWTTARHGIGDDGQELTSTVCARCCRSKREIEFQAKGQPV